MTFITVTATQTNSQGIAPAGAGNVPVTLRIHKDLIGAISQSNEILPRGGTILNVGGKFYIDVRILGNVNWDTL